MSQIPASVVAVRGTPIYLTAAHEDPAVMSLVAGVVALPEPPAAGDSDKARA